MEKRDLVRFAERDWAAIAASKAAFWANRKREHGPALALRAGEALRNQVAALRAGWPSEAERQEDLATHIRVAASLRRVPLARPD